MSDCGGVINALSFEKSSPDPFTVSFFCSSGKEYNRLSHIQSSLAPTTTCFSLSR